MFGPGVMRTWECCKVVWLWLCVCCAVQSTVVFRIPTTYYGRSKPQTSSDEFSSSTEQWFTQHLNHSDVNDNRTWNQRYWVNKYHYRPGAPVFLYVAGEWEETGFSEDLEEPWEVNGKKHYALMFKLEHRFYGKSQPTGGTLTSNDLLYLTAEQALADLANFIVTMNRQYRLPQDTKWVAFGCSYSGTLATWLRYTYPHLVYAAVASSAPLLAKVTIPEYYNAVGEAVMKFYGNITHNRTLGMKCLETLKQANRQVYDLIQTPEGLNLTFEKFGFENTLELESLKDKYSVSTEVFSLLFAPAISTVAQDNSYKDSTETWDIERFCDTLLNESLGDVIDRYVEICKIIEAESDPSENEGNRQWSYQMCTEFGMFATSEDKNSILGDYIHEENYFTSCQKEFGERFTKEFIRRGVNNTNTRYGGLALNATRVIHVHGSLDPWFPLGLNKTRHPLSPVFVIEGGSHCSDVRPRTDHDSAALIAAHINISRTLTEWLEPAASNTLF